MLSAHARHVPGDGYTAVVGERFVAAVDADARELARLWALASRVDVGIELVVGAIPASAPSFSAVVLEPSDAEGSAPAFRVTAVVKGSAAIDVFSVGGARRHAARGVTPWLLAGFSEVTALALGDGSEPTSHRVTTPPGAMPIGTGVVPVRSLVVTAGEPGEPEADGDRDRDRDRDRDDTVIRPRGSRPAGPPEGREHEGRHADPVTASDLDDRDDGEDLEDTLVRRRYRLTLPDGSHRALTGAVVVGRRPAVPPLAATPPPALVAVPSPTGAVSASHVRISRAGDAVVVTDLRSTNGTVVTRAGARGVRLRPGESITLAGSASLAIGDGNVLALEPAP